MNTIDLPNGYERIKEIDFVRNRKEVIIVNILSVTLTILMFVIGGAIYGLNRLSDLLLTDSFEKLNGLIFKCIVAAVLGVICIILHEMIHGVFMKLFCKDCRLNFGFRIFYAYAASDAYYTKKVYNIIAVAPLLIIGAAAAIACCLVPIEWFWVVYIIEIINISGAAGDIYVFSLLSRMPKDILVRDTGSLVKLYGKI